MEGSAEHQSWCKEWGERGVRPLVVVSHWPGLAVCGAAAENCVMKLLHKWCDCQQTIIVLSVS